MSSNSPSSSSPTASIGSHTSPLKNGNQSGGLTAKIGVEPIIRKGLQVISRGHRACNVCRRQKMRCEGYTDGACNRCRNTKQECIFEIPPAKQTSTATSTTTAMNAERESANHARFQRLESQIADLHFMMREVISATAIKNASPYSVAQPSGSQQAIPVQNVPLQSEPQQAGHQQRSALDAERERPRSLSTSTTKSNKRKRLDAGDLPEEGLGAPLKTLRGLAEAAIRTPRLEVNSNMTEPPSHAPFLYQSAGPSRAVSPVSGNRQAVKLNDVVSNGTLDETEARRLWSVFSQGCPRFIAACFVQDDRASSEDTFSLTRRASTFLFVTILAIGAQIDSMSNGKHAAYQICCQQAQWYAQRTLLLHAPQLRVEDVMALNLMASYSDYGWLLSGHAVRIAQELGLDTYFSKIMRMEHSLSHRRDDQRESSVSSLTSRTSAEAPLNNTSDSNDGSESDVPRTLVMGARIWFFSFLLEHQISYGAGRTAMLQHHTVDGCRDFLRLPAPLVSSIDARFVATLELMVIRERHINCLASFDQPINDLMLGNVYTLNEDLRAWLEHWTRDLRQRGYDESSFWMASLHLQCATAKLYLTSTSLRSAGIAQHGNAQTRWESLNAGRRDLVVQSVKAASDALSIAVENKEYFNLLKWAPHYTIVTVTFSAVYLLKAIRIFPSQYLLPPSILQDVFVHSEMLVSRLREIPSANKFGLVVLHMLRQCSNQMDSRSSSNTAQGSPAHQRNVREEDRYRNFTTPPPPQSQDQRFVQNPSRATQTATWSGFAPVQSSTFVPFMNGNETNLPPLQQPSSYSALPDTHQKFENFDQILYELGLDENFIGGLDNGSDKFVDFSNTAPF
ncbi:uncharacterized protein FA14DRAFT_27180 [Meira miltonrushii]|uniref:Zn(2)-C6 fungal-type domain-containing protein n=1 Tax=Meira miltonrushii TaxID=1280837 RepID=A0A316VLF4_9BASI|nr:uncharacterized protein FA14DRAFT_27180 [Meira miltonrushii]PWN38459.1 hypothetical protein FA14DRAFT_27180 [Meira miltonrushii]